jgi:hypothetical protein
MYFGQTTWNRTDIHGKISYPEEWLQTESLRPRCEENILSKEEKMEAV